MQDLCKQHHHYTDFSNGEQVLRSDDWCALRETRFTALFFCALPRRHADQSHREKCSTLVNKCMFSLWKPSHVVWEHTQVHQLPLKSCWESTSARYKSKLEEISESSQIQLTRKHSSHWWLHSQSTINCCLVQG